jgi:hypothetical protein
MSNQFVFDSHEKLNHQLKVSLIHQLRIFRDFRPFECRCPKKDVGTKFSKIKAKVMTVILDRSKKVR